MQATSLASVDTIYSADSIEWCPFAPFQDIFVCGTYQVLEPSISHVTPSVGDKGAQKSEDDVDVDDEDDGNDGNDETKEEEEVEPRQTQRTGRLLVFQVGSDQSTFEEIQRIETAAILDSKWSPTLNSDDLPVLAIADAKGHITLYHLDPSTRRLEWDQTVEVADETVLCLSLDFSPLHIDRGGQIIASLSNGFLVHLITSSEGYEVEKTWHAHDFEPWCVNWDHWDPHVVWSGGDDLKLKRWDVRDPALPSFVNKNFKAGVTTITSSPHLPHLLVVGSYDESIRLFDTRSPRSPISIIPLGGGIWRCRFHPHPSRANDLLVACMHDGFKVVHLNNEINQKPIPLSDNVTPTTTKSSNGGEIIKRFDGHASLAYGADWSRLPSPDGSTDTTLVATCSFYDHTMHIWRG